MGLFGDRPRAVHPDRHRGRTATGDGSAFPAPLPPSIRGAALAMLLAALGPGCTPAVPLQGAAEHSGAGQAEAGSPPAPEARATPPGASSGDSSGKGASADRDAGKQDAAAPEGQATPSPASVVLPVDPSRPISADGLRYPLVPADPVALASLLGAVEDALRAASTPAADLPALGHQQQVIYRVLSHRPELAAQVRGHLAPRWQRGFDLQLAARRAFNSMHSPTRRPRQVPAWRILRPEAPENLLRDYREAAAATGIPWQVLAAVNLVESGMGRIDGVSVADARGPMQFLPSTWAEPGIGKGGDIRDPRTAIHAAARYLVRRGGLHDIRKALWGYNNSDAYGQGVLLYATLLREDPAAYTGLYHWQIHYAAAGGDLWFPVGYDLPRPLAVAEFLKRSPLSAPPPGSSGY